MIKDLNFNQLLKQSTQTYREQIFLQYEDISFTYQEMWEKTNRLAHGFANIGISKGDHVALIVSNRPEFIWSWFALSKIGAIAVTIDIRLKGDLLLYQLKNSQSKVLISEDSLLASQLLGNLTETDLTDIIVITDQSFNPLLQDLKVNVCNFDSLLEYSTSTDDIVIYDLPSGWPLTIVYTSGTTGPSKGVVNPHETFVLSGQDIGEAVGMTQKDKLFTFLPLFHANPQLMGIPAMILNGASMVLGKKFSASTFWNTVNHFGVTIFTYVGTVLSILDKVTPEAIPNSLRAAYGGGAPEKVWKRLENKIGASIIEGYGMAEIGGFAIMNSTNDIKFGSIGKSRKIYDIRLFDEDDREVLPGETGEIVVRPNIPYSMFTTYLNMEKAMVSSMRNLWFHTGDLAKRDKEGYFYFMGRKKNMIRRNGENISSYEIEDIVQQHPKILENAVVPVPDEIAGEEIKLSIVLKAGEQLSIPQLNQWLAENLPFHMVPRYLNIRREFEKTSSEKIKIQVLIEEGTQDTWDRLNPINSMKEV